VRPKDESAGKAHEHVLAGRLDRSTVRPVMGVSSWTRVSAGKTDSKRTTVPPAARG
jgi:hypothetical protein